MTLPIVEDIAGRALDIIDERGWTQGADALGDDGPVCVGMALSLAAAELFECPWPVYMQACRAFEMNVGLSGEWRPKSSVTLVTWNDAPGRTRRDVEEALAKLAGREMLL